MVHAAAYARANLVLVFDDVITAQEEVMTETQPRVARPHMFLQTDAEGVIRHISEYTAGVLGYLPAELIGIRVVGSALMPDVSPEERERLFASVRARPGEVFVSEHRHVFARDGHRVELLKVALRWVPADQLVWIDGEITEEEDARTRMHGPQFRGFVEREPFARWIERGDAARAHVVAGLPPKAGAQKWRVWREQDTLLAALHQTYEAIDDEGMGWEAVTIEEVCKRLSLREHISENTLKDRFEAFGWMVVGGSLTRSLREQSAEYLSGRYD